MSKTVLFQTIQFSISTQHYWNLTIRLLSVICRTIVGAVVLSFSRCGGLCILLPKPTGQYTELMSKQFYFELFSLA